jgi:pyruvate/2-oxoglutarate dehydrogenase complex dihydrolipoamide acyltransferase (E2) component
MTLAPSLPRPDRIVADPGRFAPAALAVESATVDVTELLALVDRLDAHARISGEQVSVRGLVGRALLTAGARHPGVDARWPALPAQHGLRVSELTAAIEQAVAASPLPDDAAVLSVGAVVAQSLPTSLGFDPRRTDAVAAGMLLRELALLLADPFELVARA